jgi:hypothetical protein
MLYVWIAKQKASTSSAEAITRRVQWEPSEGSQILGEYWLQTNDPALPSVISVFEIDDMAGVMENFAAWDDIFEITVVPAVSAEEGLQMAQQMMDQQNQG